ncbi:histidine triad (HIT) protein [Nanobdella aerobiophila]|uniref:Histidine triad (HIT) protein n=1 Tax=Nanobdella aerobiophila TaxID=2586965 RepID=A0A915WT51_9ARCH|nr:HIT domain-containing protein [Nanobdella aerobiophila]BBL45867.1 histidine triad (HIT) protein [Nanobdella aerobiophila]
MDDCIYCKIANKILPSYTLYEDNDIIAVLDIYPPSKGSVLVFPKMHLEEFENLNDIINQKLFTIAKYISFILKNNLKYDGMNLLLSSGNTKTNSTHIVIQIIPRYKEDNINFYLKKYKEDPQGLELLSRYVKEGLVSLSQQYLYKEEKKEEKKEDKKEDKDYSRYEIWFKKRI